MQSPHFLCSQIDEYQFAEASKCLRNSVSRGNIEVTKMKLLLLMRLSTLEDTTSIIQVLVFSLPLGKERLLECLSYGH